ncbi:MAG: WD40 repeat domain-containing protein [Microscillaceae bacterium]|jgi:WD40 repeat protein|nr:WD40 repeat domain-containing protein [Microscillaceae bacterium]
MKGIENQPIKRFFDAEGHLNDSGITLYVEGLKLDRTKELPEELQEHLDECAHCQYEVMDFYQLMKEEDVSQLTTHPYFDRPQKYTLKQKIYRLSPKLARVAGVLALFAVVSMLYLLGSRPRYEWVSEIKSPFHNPQIAPQFTDYQINSSQNQTLSLPNGTTIFVPAHSFVDVEGKPVSGSVQLLYREMHSANELIAGGIPLEYDSLGKKYPLESAGLFEIRGLKNGEPISIASDKVVSVKMTSFHNGTGFNSYFLNEPKSIAQVINHPLVSEVLADNPAAKWEYLGKSQLLEPLQKVESQSFEKLKNKKIEEADLLEKEIKAKQREILNEQVNTQITRAIARNTQKKYFKLALNMKQNPVLLKYCEQVFQYAGENPAESPTAQNEWIFQEKWDDLRLVPLKYKPLTLKGHTAPVKNAAFSPDGTLIATASADHSIKLWSNEAQYKYTLNGHTAAVNSVAFSPDNRYLLSASDDHTAKIWTAQGDLSYTLQGHKQGVKSAVFLPNGKLILTSSDDNTAKIWTLEGQLLKTLPNRTQLSEAKVSRDGQQIITLSDSLARVWTSEGKELFSFKGTFSSVSFSANGKFILTTSRNTATGRAILWSKEGKLLKTFDLNDTQARFTPNGNHILTFGGNNARLWYFNQSLYFSTQLISNMRNLDSDTGRGHEGAILQTNFTQDGSMIASASQDRTARIWSAEGRLLHVLRGHNAGVNSVAFSPDNRQILTTSADFTAKLWVEREVDDVLELELIKHKKELFDEYGRLITIAGKRFYSTVRFASPEIAENKIKNPEPETNLLNQLTEKYEKVLTDIKAIEHQSLPIKKYHRFLTIKKLGIYQFARPFSIEESERKTALWQLISPQNTRPIALYQITGSFKTAVIPYQIADNQTLMVQFNPNLSNRFVAVYPHDEVLVFALPDDWSPDKKPSDTAFKIELVLDKHLKISRRTDWLEANN